MLAATKPLDSRWRSHRELSFRVQQVSSSLISIQFST